MTIPQVAYNAATLLALGADEIVMHTCGNLGLVDPKLRIQKKADKNSPREIIEFGSDDLEGFIDYSREKIGLQDQEQIRHAFELLCNETGAIAVAKASRSSKLSLSLGTKLLEMHMKDDVTKQKAAGNPYKGEDSLKQAFNGALRRAREERKQKRDAIFTEAVRELRHIKDRLFSEIEKHAKEVMTKDGHHGTRISAGYATLVFDTALGIKISDSEEMGEPLAGESINAALAGIL